MRWHTTNNTPTVQNVLIWIHLLFKRHGMHAKNMCYRKCRKCICNVVFVFNQSGQRNKMPYHRMSNRDRYEAVGMLRGMTVNDVAVHFNLNRSTIFRLKRKLNQTGDGVDLQRTGRPRKTSAAEDRHLRTLHLRNRFRSASETARNWARNEWISLRTVLRRLKNAGLRSRRPVQKQVLNKRHIADRLAWATRHRRQTQMQWSRIIWSFKKCFHVDKKDGRIRCFRRQNERFQRPNIHQYGPRQSIMVWAAISAEGKSEIMRFHWNVTAIRYQNEALRPGLLPFINRHMPQMLFMQDNAQPTAYL